MNIIFVGLSGVPYKKRACDIRLLSFANAFIAKGNKVTILNRFPTSCETDLDFVKHKNLNLQIIELINLERPAKTFNLILLKIYSYIKEVFYLLRFNKKEKIDILHLYSGHYFEFLHYYMISRLIGAKVVYQYVEVRSSKKSKGVYHKLNGILCDNVGYKLFDGVISISTYIDNLVKKKSPKLPILKIPPICNDFSNKSDESIIKEPYILFCGSVGYIDIIKVIIDSYKFSVISKSHKLVLILSGSDKQKEYFKNYAEIEVKIMSGLSYDDLITVYSHSAALLIPINTTTEDKARFPNKICEYASCKGVIVTTNNGEIPYFFKDRVNALIANDFSVEAISNKLNELSKMSVEDILQIKNGAYQVYQSSFDISLYISPLDELLNKVLLNRMQFN